MLTDLLDASSFLRVYFEDFTEDADQRFAGMLRDLVFASLDHIVQFG